MDPARRGPRRAPGRLHRDVPDRLPRRGPGAAHLVRGGVDLRGRGGRATAGGGGARRAPGGRRLRGPREAHPARRPAQGSPARTRRRCCTGDGWSSGPPSTTCPTTASSTSTATSSAATGCRSSGCTASTWRSRSARTSGRRAAPSRWRPRPGPVCWWCRTPRRTSGGRTTCGWRWCARRAREAGCVLAYVNQVGGQDELIFDGDSLVVSASGELHRARGAVSPRNCSVTDLELPEARYGGLGEFQMDAGDNSVITVERLELASRPPEPYDPQPPTIAEQLDDPAEVYSALVLGVRDYVAKNGFSSVILGLSGGIDSALVATIASDALGAGAGARGRDALPLLLRPLGERRPGTGRAAGDRHHRIVPIADIVERLREASSSLTGLAAENLQARVRGTILMGLSNQHGPPGPHHRQQERAGRRLLHPLRRLRGRLRADQGRARRRWSGSCRAGATPRRGRFLRGFEVPPIPESSIEKAPSAELRPGQRDTDSLPDYDRAGPAPRRLRRADMGLPSCSPPATTPRWSTG